MTSVISGQDADLRAPHVSCRLVVPVLVHFEEQYGRAFVDGMLAECGLPRDYVEDPEKWVSIGWVERSMVELVRRTGYGGIFPPYDNEVWQHWYAIGKRTMTRESLGATWVALQALGSPGVLYQQLPAITSRGNRTLSIQYRSLADCLVEIEVATIDGGPGWYPGSCWNIRGILEAIPPIWGLPPATLEHHSCAFSKDNPAATCTYRVRFEERRLARVAGVAAASGIGAALGVGATLLAGQPSWLGVAPVAGAGVMLASYFAYRLHRAEQRLAEEGRRLGEIIDENDQRYDELWQEGREVRRALLASKKLSGYLARDLVEAIIADPDQEMHLGGQTTQAAVLFADLVGFTSRCERLNPQQVVSELNCYFGHIDPAFQAHGGVIDKRMGDGVMAVFVPRADADAREVRRRAVRCAVDLLAGLAVCNRELEAIGSEPLQVRVGIAAGSLVQGTMGSDVKLEYTVIGDVVNLAARLESQARPGHVLVSTDVFESFGGQPPPGLAVAGRQILYVKGKQQAVDVVELAASG